MIYAGLKRIILSAAVLLPGWALKSQTVCSAGNIQFKIECHDLYSTHRDQFRGVSFSVSRSVSPMVTLGLGTEFSGNRFHFDNGFNLYHLRFLPVFADQQLTLRRKGRLYPVLHFSEGMSFARYRKEMPLNPGSNQHIHEKGIYLYAGGGLIRKLSDKLSLIAESGIKGFHNSFNALDVNPHGLTGRVGLIF